MAGPLRNIWQTRCFPCMSFHPSYFPYCTDPLEFCIWYPRHNLSVVDTAGLFSLCKFLFTCPFVSGVQFSSYVLILRVMLRGFAWIQVLTEGGGTMERWHGSEVERKEERGETARCRVEDRSRPAGGSPQATSDIPLSDGLMRLPWHFFLPT